MAELHLRTKYSDDAARTEGGVYSDGSIAIRLLSLDTGEPLNVATVCLADYNLKPREGHVFIKDWSENEGMYNALLLGGIVGPAVAEHKVGYNDSCTAYECPLLVEVL